MTMDFNPRPINTNDARVVGTAPRFDFEKEMNDALRTVFGSIACPTSTSPSSQSTSNQNWNWNGDGNTDIAHHQNSSSSTFYAGSTLSQFYLWRNDTRGKPSATLSQSAMMLPKMVPAWASSSESSSSSSSLAAQAWTSNSER
jgi:hypothetical protein